MHGRKCFSRFVLVHILVIITHLNHSWLSGICVGANSGYYDSLKPVMAQWNLVVRKSSYLLVI